jgi:hypothetical protein
MQYHYFKTCVDHSQEEVPALCAMIDEAIDISLRTFRKHCIGFAEIAKQLGYERDSRKGLTIANDWHVSYHRSKYNGKRCYYLRWSAIEHIWLPS